MNTDATVEAIALLRDLSTWCRARAYLRLERELQAYLLGKE